MGPRLDWLVAARKAAGLTQAQLATAVGGLSQGAIVAWESGRKPVPQERVERLAVILGLDPWVIEVGLGRIPADLTELRRTEPARVAASLRGV